MCLKYSDTLDFGEEGRWVLTCLGGLTVATRCSSVSEQSFSSDTDSGEEDGDGALPVPVKKTSSYSWEMTSELSLRQLRFFLDHLTDQLVRTRPAVSDSITRLLSFLTRGDVRGMETLLEFFDPSLDFKELDVIGLYDFDRTYLVNCFVQVVKSIPYGENDLRVPLFFHRRILA